MLNAPHSAASENSVYGIQHFFWLCTVDSLRRMHSYSVLVQTKQKIEVAIKSNFEFAYSFTRECGHGIHQQKIRGWAWNSGQLCHHSHSLKLCILGLSRSTTPLTTNKYWHAVGERHVGEMQPRECNLWWQSTWQLGVCLPMPRTKQQ